MAWRTPPWRQLTTATPLASMRKASFVRTVSNSFGVCAACGKLHLPRKAFSCCFKSYRTVPYGSRYCIVQ
jgi:hypothetical protein